MKLLSCACILAAFTSLLQAEVREFKNNKGQIDPAEALWLLVDNDGRGAVIGVASQGATFGSGYAATRAMLDETQNVSQLYLLLKFVATWLTN